MNINYYEQKQILKPLLLRIVYGVYKPNLKGPKRLWRSPNCHSRRAEVPLMRGQSVLTRGKSIFSKKRAEVVGAEVVGAEVSIPFHLRL